MFVESSSGYLGETGFTGPPHRSDWLCNGAARWAAACCLFNAQLFGAACGRVNALVIVTKDNRENIKGHASYHLTATARYRLIYDEIMLLIRTNDLVLDAFIVFLYILIGCIIAPAAGSLHQDIIIIHSFTCNIFILGKSLNYSPQL